MKKKPQSFDRLKGRKGALKELAALRSIRNQMTNDPTLYVRAESFTSALDRLADTIDNYILPESGESSYETVLFVPVPKRKRVPE